MRPKVNPLTLSAIGQVKEAQNGDGVAKGRPAEFGHQPRPAIGGQDAAATATYCTPLTR
jgi:hypothetical protein